jgi:hypothetical protein
MSTSPTLARQVPHVPSMKPILLPPLPPSLWRNYTTIG